jgi:hypothetical protein
MKVVSERILTTADATIRGEPLASDHHETSER